MPKKPGSQPQKPNPKKNPLELSIPDAARLFSQLSEREITEGNLRADIAAGAPVNADGSLNLIEFTAWLVREADSGV